MYNLLSISQLRDRNFNISFKSSHCIVTSSFDESIKFIGKRHGNVYIIDLDELKNENIECLVAINAKVNKFSWIWHNRLGHASMDSLARLIKLDSVKFLSKINFEKNKIYKVCQLGKQTNFFFKSKRIILTSWSLELLYMICLDLFQLLVVEEKDMVMLKLMIF